MSKQKRNQRASGFTLMEVIAVLVLMAIIMAIAAPSFISWLPSYRLSAAARQVAGDLQLARMKAISQNTAFQVSYSSKTYVIQKCTPSCASPTNDSGNIVLPEGITAAASATPQFQPRGTAGVTATITLTNDLSATKLVCVKAVGRVDIQDSSCS